MTSFVHVQSKQSVSILRNACRQRNIAMRDYQESVTTAFATVAHLRTMNA